MWYYLEADQQRGPVTDGDLEALRRDGKINAETLVWREGMGDWQPLRAVQPAAGSASSAGGQAASPEAPPIIGGAAPSGGLICAECGKAFQPDEVVRVHDRWVCAACKPIFLQRVREGSMAGARPTVGMVSEAQVRERDYEHDIGDYFNQSLTLLKSDPGMMLAATVVVGLCIMVAAFIPYLSYITSIVFMGPLLGGLYLFYLKKLRGQTASVGDAFGGFGPRFGQLLLARFIPSLLAMLALIPAGAVFVIFFFARVASHSNGPPDITFATPLIIAGVLALVGYCVMVYFQMCWIFTLWLVADKNMSFWPAMSLSRAVVCKHWWYTFLLGLVTGLLVVAGFVLLCLGLLFTAPLALGMWACAYERLFGDLEPA
jgi:hypothetical protein